MIGKILSNGSFKGAVSYVMKNKGEARLLKAEGVLWESKEAIAGSFEMQSMMKPNIKNPAGHISLSYSASDKDRLTDGAMVKLAEEYLTEMGITDTQYIIVRHTDTEHPHVHIVYNRIDNNGNRISDKHEKYRNVKVCKELKDKYRLTYGKGKEKVKQQRLRGKNKIKYEIFSAIKNILSRSANWNEFEKRLQGQGITFSYKYKGQTNIIQGISFTKGNLTFKGSEIDRSFSYARLNSKLSGNSLKNQQNVTTQQSQHTQSSKSSLFSMLGSTSNATNYDNEKAARQAEYEQEKINRKNKRKKGRRL